jgi:hypothetical protein
MLLYVFKSTSCVYVAVCRAAMCLSSNASLMSSNICISVAIYLTAMCLSSNASLMSSNICISVAIYLTAVCLSSNASLMPSIYCVYSISQYALLNCVSHPMLLLCLCLYCVYACRVFLSCNACVMSSHLSLDYCVSVPVCFPVVCLSRIANLMSSQLLCLSCTIPPSCIVSLIQCT